MKKYEDQIGCAFIIDGEEFIFEGVTLNEKPKDLRGQRKEHSICCNRCGNPVGRTEYNFNSLRGYNDGTYESRVYGSECIKKIIQVGYGK